MVKENVAQTTIIKFPLSAIYSDNTRKTGLNRNKEGSVRKLNGKVYVDFMYLGERGSGGTVYRRSGASCKILV